MYIYIYIYIYIYSYIYVHVRICERKGVSRLTGKHFDRPSFSAVREHSMSCASIALDGFQILARGNTDIELLIKESLLIADQRPILNSNISSLELRVFN